MFTVNWHPFAIEINDKPDYWEQPWASASSELRGFIAAEAARQQGSEPFLRFHDALERGVHEEFMELGEEATLLRAAQLAGLDLDPFQTAWHDFGLTQRLRERHAHAMECHQIFGTPSLVFDGGAPYYLELREIPQKTDALTVFQAVETLASGSPYLRQLKRRKKVTSSICHEDKNAPIARLLPSGGSA
jgi:hypothetical protein